MKYGRTEERLYGGRGLVDGQTNKAPARALLSGGGGRRTPVLQQGDQSKSDGALKVSEAPHSF